MDSYKLLSVVSASSFSDLLFQGAKWENIIGANYICILPIILL